MWVESASWQIRSSIHVVNTYWIFWEFSELLWILRCFHLVDAVTYTQPWGTSCLFMPSLGKPWPYSFQSRELIHVLSSISIVAFNLVELTVPKSCGDLKFSSFKQCSDDAGKRYGCCAKKCTKWLHGVSGKWWYEAIDLLPMLLF